MVLGVIALGLLVVLAVAGVTAATAVLVTGAAVLAMIVLGNQLGARRTPERAPIGAASEAFGDASAPVHGQPSTGAGAAGDVNQQSEQSGRPAGAGPADAGPDDARPEDIGPDDARAGDVRTEATGHEAGGRGER